jgi:hypothetical protein
VFVAARKKREEKCEKNKKCSLNEADKLIMSKVLNAYTQKMEEKISLYPDFNVLSQIRKLHIHFSLKTGQIILHQIGKDVKRGQNIRKE